MCLIGTVEMLHIPSGHIINMSGNFKVSKNFQIIACALLIASMALLGTVFGVYGMLGSLLIVAVLLAVLEIGFVHTKFFVGKGEDFIKMMIPYTIVGVSIAYIEMNGIKGENTIISFLLMGFIFMVINTLLGIVLGYLFNRRELEKLINRGKGLLKRVSGKSI